MMPDNYWSGLVGRPGPLTSRIQNLRRARLIAASEAEDGKKFVLTAGTWYEAVREASSYPRRTVKERLAYDLAWVHYYGRGYVGPTPKEELLGRLNSRLKGRKNSTPVNWRGLPKEND